MTTPRKPRKPRYRPKSLRALLTVAPYVPTDGDRLTIDGYCKNVRCRRRWVMQDALPLAASLPLPTQLTCPSCGRRLYHYQLSGYRSSALLTSPTRRA